MSQHKERFLPGPNCRDDDVCYFIGECKEARKIRDELAKQKIIGSSLVEYEINTSVCQSIDAIQARKDGESVIWDQYRRGHS